MQYTPGESAAQPHRPKTPLSDDDRTLIRSAAFYLLPGIGMPLPSAQEVAEQVGLPRDQVEALFVDFSHTCEFLLEPFAAAAERTLNTFSIRRSPGLDDQRAVLEAAIRVCAQFPNQMRLLLGLFDREGHEHGNQIADSILYSTGVRIIGIDHEDDPQMRRRVAFVGELVAMAVVSHRHGLQGKDLPEEEFNSLVSACLGILHPPAL